MISLPLAQIEDYLKVQMEQQHIPGLAVAIVQDGAILLARGYGIANLEWDIATTPDTAFQLASATKPLTGTALMLLVEEGALALDVPITAYLPEAPATWGAITLRRLASHTSGIPDILALGRPIANLAEAFHIAAELPLVYPPGTQVGYASGDYSILMHLIARVAGASFPEMLQKRLLTPLGMAATRFDHAADHGPIRSADLVPRRASIYRWEGGIQRASSFLYPSWTYTAGGLYSSASDLATWAAALDSGKLLAPSSLEEIWANQRLEDGTPIPFGLGWVVESHRGRKVVGHSGGPALGDIVRFVEEKLTIVVLTNQQGFHPYLALGVADLL